MSAISENWIVRLVFSLISFMAFLGNALVLWMFIRKHKTSIKTSFDVFIVNLAISDLLAAVFLVFSRFLYLPTMPSSQPEAFLLCNILWGGYILFGLGYVSVYTCLALTIDRWLAVVKPHLYRRVERKHVILTVIIVWIWAFFINSTVFVSVSVNFQQEKCEWIEPQVGKFFLPFLELCVACVIPFSIIIILYAHIFYKIHRMPTFIKKTRNAFKKRLTILAFAASAALIVGWLPVKISYMLRFTSIGRSHLHGIAHLIFIMMALGNSCVNPILYGFYSSKFRDEYKRIFYQMFHCNKRSETDIEAEEQMIPMNILQKV